MSQRVFHHCLHCRTNVDALICPRCSRLTERGRLKRPTFQRASRADDYDPPTYRLFLPYVREGGVDVEAS